MSIISIIPENPALHGDEIEALYDETFGPGHFAKTAERLREYNHSLPALSRVAMRDNRVVAAMRLWPVSIEQGGDAVFFGPLAVSPSERGSKLGLKVTKAALDAAREAGWQGAILIGSPSYFVELGFEQVPAGQLIFPGPQDQSRILIAHLAGDARAYKGKIVAAETAY